jgi:hypothetical protein
MTRSKTELAIILVKLQGEITDPKKIEKEATKLANEMSLMKLCYEIQKVEEEREEAPAVPESQTSDAPEKADETEPTPVELTKKEEEIVEELKAPDQATSKQKHKHILSWLLDSSSDEEAA